jgi:PST family polysaccharide transporter
LYTVANSFILGVIAGPVAVAFYGSGEKVIRASISMLSPISQALFPRVSHLVVHDPAAARRLVRRILLPVGGLGLALGVGTALAAPIITRVLFGPGYGQVVPILRILALLPPIQAFGAVLGIQWVLPLGREAIYNRLVISAGVCNLVLAAVLLPWLGAMGMATSAVIADGLVTIGLVVVVARMGDSPWVRAVAPVVPSTGS